MKKLNFNLMKFDLMISSQIKYFANDLFNNKKILKSKSEVLTISDFAQLSSSSTFTAKTY
jgi:hypothetical protein